MRWPRRDGRPARGRSPGSPAGRRARPRARQEAVDREVALKIVTVPVDDDVRRRFVREVMLAGRQTGHPNVVTALDAGLTRSGRPYLVMDLHEDGSLADRLAAEGPLPATEVARIGATIAGALDAAHAAARGAGIGQRHRPESRDRHIRTRLDDVRAACGPAGLRRQGSRSSRCCSRSSPPNRPN